MIKYLDDHLVGDTGRAGPYRVGRDEVKAFSADFARPFADDDPAKPPLKASGAHYLAIFQRLQIDMAIDQGAAASYLAAVGIEDLRWTGPLHSGDVLYLDAEVLDVTRSSSKPDRGIVRTRYSLSNEQGIVLLTLISGMMMRRRPDAGSLPEESLP